MDLLTEARGGGRKCVCLFIPCSNTMRRTGMGKQALILAMWVVLIGGVRSHYPSIRIPRSPTPETFTGGRSTIRKSSVATRSPHRNATSSKYSSSSRVATSAAPDLSSPPRATTTAAPDLSSPPRATTTAAPDTSSSDHEHLSFVTVAEANELRDSVASLSNLVGQVQKEFNSSVEHLQHLMHSISMKLHSNIVSANAQHEKLNSSVREVRESLRPSVESLLKLMNRVSSVVHPFCGSLPWGSVCGEHCFCRDDRRLASTYFCDCRLLAPKHDCRGFLEEGSTIDGLYTVRQDNATNVQVYCDQTTDGGGWTVIQRRIDGSEKFYRDWNSYRNGFGDHQHEFWLGNTHLHTMTNTRNHHDTEMRVELHDWEGEKVFAKYSHFRVGSEEDEFRLHVDGYSGNAGDGGKGLLFHDGYKFSTFDRDNDESSDHCAVNYSAGWWYERCHYVNVNGRYYDYGRMGTPGEGIHWYPFHGYTYSLKFVEMKIRRKE